MSEPDSFLDEVTEEVRRDRLIGFLRRNAVWIGAAVIVIVGGASAWEWRKASMRAAAQERGAAMWAALEAGDDGARREQLSRIELPGAAGEAFLALHRAAAAVAADDRAAAVEDLQAIAARGDIPEALRDVARLKLVALGHDILDAGLRLDVLEALSREGHPLRALALEQRAAIRLSQGDTAGAAEDLETVADAPEADLDTRRRAREVLLALGEDGAPGDG